MAQNELTKYLSKDILNSISLHVHNNEDGNTKDGFLLMDGTSIVITKVPAGSLTVSDTYIRNPYGIRITGPCKIIIKYTANAKEKLARFAVNSLSQLEAQWNKFKQQKKLSIETIGTIDSTELNDDEIIINGKIVEHLNSVINILLDSRVSITDATKDASNRYNLIGEYLTHIANDLMINHNVGKIHCPMKVTDDETGKVIEIKEYVTSNDYREYLSAYNNTIDNEKDYDDEEEKDSPDGL